MTTWMPIASHLHYEVSSLGIVREVGGRELGQYNNDRGYPLVRLRGPRAEVSVHRLVAKAFVPNPDNKPCVNHIDCVRSNNVAANLEWCTQAENIHHSIRLGRYANNYWVGKRSPNASLDDAAVTTIRDLYRSGAGSLAVLGERFGVSKRTIGRIINRENYADVR